MIQGEIMMMTREQLLEKSTVLMVITAKSELDRQQQISEYLERCKQHKCKGEAEKLIRSVRQDLKEEQKQLVINNVTHFERGENLNCGMWIADMTGVKAFSDKGGYKLACYHPIMPVERLINIEDKTEKIKLTYFRDNTWKEITVDKDIIASNSKIVKLAAYGIAVTTESSKNLVSYLADVENLNTIPVSKSTSKFGWCDGEFIPYDARIKFDDDSRLKDLHSSIHFTGSENVWFDLVREIRTNKSHYEPQLSISASLASVLIKPLNMLPFIFNLWGKTGGGKTVCLMLAASVWADPAEGKYITDSYATQNAFEVRLDALNHMPLMLDDLSKTKDKYGDNFTDLIYLIASGKGKERSNIDLGLNKSKTWRNVTLSNMERPLANDTMRGGAINRVIDIEMAGGDIFKNGNVIVETIKDNYGFAGFVFVEIIKALGIDIISDMRKDFEKQIKAEMARQNSFKEEKQILPLSVILTADKLATDYIFKDGIYLDLARMVGQLKDVEDVSEGRRAFDAILDFVFTNKSRFPNELPSYEAWGYVRDGYINIVPSVLKKLAIEQNFSVKAFCSWAKEHAMLKTNNGKNQNIIKVNGRQQKFYSIKQELTEEISGIEALPDDIPFD